MTNLARLIQKDKEAFSCIEEIVSMGGSFKSHGNCSPVAEYNYWCDPDGASLVYETLHQNGQKIHMVGLDVTRKIVLTPDLLLITGYFRQKALSKPVFSVSIQSIHVIPP